MGRFIASPTVRDRASLGTKLADGSRSDTREHVGGQADLDDELRARGRSSLVAIVQWESIEQYNAWRKSAAYVDARKIADKYAKFRSFAIEGTPQ